jgi:hypothetical protein
VVENPIKDKHRIEWEEEESMIEPREVVVGLKIVTGLGLAMKLLVAGTRLSQVLVAARAVD